MLRILSPTSCGSFAPLRLCCLSSSSDMDTYFLQVHLTWIVQPFAPLSLQEFPHYYGFCWLLVIRCYYGFPLTRPHGISSPVFPRLPAWFTCMGYGCLLDFVTSGPLIRHAGLGIRFLFVRLRFHYPFFSPIPHDMNLGSRFLVRRQLRPLWTFTTDWRHARHTWKKCDTYTGYRTF